MTPLPGIVLAPLKLMVGRKLIDIDNPMQPFKKKRLLKKKAGRSIDNTRDGILLKVDDGSDNGRLLLHSDRGPTFRKGSPDGAELITLKSTRRESSAGAAPVYAKS